MSAVPGRSAPPTVPAQVFEKFIEALRGTDVPVEVVTRLQKVLLEDGLLTERALRAAILSEPPLP